MVASVSVCSRLLVCETATEQPLRANRLQSVAIVPLVRLILVVQNAWVLNPIEDPDYSCASCLCTLQRS